MGLFKTIGSSAYQAGVLWTSGLRVLYSAYGQLATVFDFYLADVTKLKSVGAFSTAFNVFLCLPDNLALDSSIANLGFKLTVGFDVVQTGAATWEFRVSSNTDATSTVITSNGYYQASYTWAAADAASLKGIVTVPIQAKSSTGGLGDNIVFSRIYGAHGPDCFAGCILT